MNKWELSGAEALKLIESKGGINMVKADYLFTDEYERSSPYWKRLIESVKVVESDESLRNRILSK